MNAERFLILSAAAAVLSTPSAYASQSLETAKRKVGNEVLAAFETQRAVMQQCSAVIKQGRDQLSYGTVVSADGYVLTKASEIAEAQGLTVIVAAQTFNEVKRVAVDQAWDVALLKVEATGLKPVVYRESELAQGTWVVANGASSLAQRRVAVGIISAKPRAIPPEGGLALGVLFDPAAKKLLIKEVAEKSGAKDAGLLAGDVIVAINDKPLTTGEEMSDLLEKAKDGEVVKVSYLRKGKPHQVEVKLKACGEMFEQPESRNDEMSGHYSKRRGNFPMVLQHDILANNKMIGGPLLDLDGKCVGMNIARADRAQTFAIPAAELPKLLEKLKAQGK